MGISFECYYCSSEGFDPPPSTSLYSQQQKIFHTYIMHFLWCEFNSNAHCGAYYITNMVNLFLSDIVLPFGMYLDDTY